MAVSVLFVSMSVDGYIAGPNDTSENPGGDRFMRLHDWFHFGQEEQDAEAGGDVGLPAVAGPENELIEEYKTVGAIVAGRRTVEMVDHWGGERHGARIFVPSHRPPAPSVAKYPKVTYVLDGIASAMAQAKASAAEGTVLVHGAYTAHTALAAGVLDEIQIHQVPVLFGDGRRLFDVLPYRIELEIVRVIDTPEATHIRYRVRR